MRRFLFAAAIAAVAGLFAPAPAAACDGPLRRAAQAIRLAVASAREPMTTATPRYAVFAPTAYSASTSPPVVFRPVGTATISSPVAVWHRSPSPVAAASPSTQTIVPATYTQFVPPTCNGPSCQAAP
jgi:hypothetical protein